MRRISLKLLGFLCVVMGMIGAFIPLLPTTPFLLLAIFFFARSSPRYTYRMIHNPILRPYIKGYVDGTGMTKGVKIRALSVLWISILGTCFFLTDNTTVRIILPTIAVCVSIHILRLKTAK